MKKISLTKEEFEEIISTSYKAGYNLNERLQQNIIEVERFIRSSKLEEARIIANKEISLEEGLSLFIKDTLSQVEFVEPSPKSYKIQHIPTGLFFTPSKGSGNLSNTGKIYHKLPSLKWIGTSIRIVTYYNTSSKFVNKIADYFKIEQSEKKRLDKYYKTNEKDWRIVEL